MASAPTQYTMIGGGVGNPQYAALVYVDANGGLAGVHTNFYITSGNVLVPAPLDGSSRPLFTLAAAIPAGSNVIGGVTEASLDGASATPGAAVPTKALQISGTDGTDARVLLVDTSGRALVTVATALPAGTNTIGSVNIAGTLPAFASPPAVTEANLDAAAAGAGTAVPAKALQVGGSDGTDLRTIATDTLGRQIVTTTGTLTDGSGTIATGGTAQTVFAANANRRYLLVQNNSSGALWVNFTTTAVESQPSVQLAANGGSIVMETGFVSTEAISIIGATTGQAFTAKQA